MKRLSLILAALAAAALPAIAPAWAAEKEVIAPGLEAAIDRGLFFLQKQQKADGSFDAAGPANGMTGLAILAYLSAGHTPDVGRYGLTVRSAIDQLVNQRVEGGYYGRDGGRMYSHCIVTIALAQAYGTESDEAQRKKVRTTLERCLRVILAAQDVGKAPAAAGGWRYEPSSTDSDLSVTAWCLSALRACHDAGLNVPRERFGRGLAYVLKCYRADQKGFAYLPGEAASSSMTAAALVNLRKLDAALRPEAQAAEKYLAEKPVREGTKYFYYALYYATQASFLVGDSLWPAAWRNAQEQLMAMQRKDDGSWPPREGEPGGDQKTGRFYSTSMAVLTLSTPLRLLPGQ